MDVSIVIPCFNHAATLERAVDSALRQSGVTEVIVVDDVSSDHSYSVAQGLPVAHDRVRANAQLRNSGPGAARNRGVKEATGALICFLDADDELMGDFIESAISLFQQNPELVVVKCETDFFDPVKGYILPDFDPRHQAAVLSSSCGMLMRREHFLRMGGFPEDPAFRGPAGGEDVAFMQAVMAHFQPIARIEKAGYRVWSQAGSHLDRFLAKTRLNSQGAFDFVESQMHHEDSGMLADAIDRYLKFVASNLPPHTSTLNT